LFLEKHAVSGASSARRLRRTGFVVLTLVRSYNFAFFSIQKPKTPTDPVRVLSGATLVFFSVLDSIISVLVQKKKNISFFALTAMFGITINIYMASLR
jgi:hypothetical protein